MTLSTLHGDKQGITQQNFLIGKAKTLLIDSLLISLLDSTYLNIDMCKFELSQKDESSALSADFSKFHGKHRAFNCYKYGY